MTALPAESGDPADLGHDLPVPRATPAAPPRARAARGVPAAARPRRPGLQVLPARRRATAPLAPFVAVVTGLLVLGLVALLGLNTLLAQDAFRIHDLEQSNARLAEREQALDRQVSALESPATLAERARELGMLPSSSPLFLRLPDGAVLGAAPEGAAGSADPDAIAAVQAAAEAAQAGTGGPADRAAESPTAPSTAAVGSSSSGADSADSAGSAESTESGTDKDTAGEGASDDGTDQAEEESP